MTSKAEGVQLRDTAAETAAGGAADAEDEEDVADAAENMKPLVSPPAPTPVGGDGPFLSPVAIWKRRANIGAAGSRAAGPPCCTKSKFKCAMRSITSIYQRAFDHKGIYTIYCPGTRITGIRYIRIRM